MRKKLLQLIKWCLCYKEPFTAFHLTTSKFYPPDHYALLSDEEKEKYKNVVINELKKSLATQLVKHCSIIEEEIPFLDKSTYQAKISILIPNAKTN